MQHGPNLEWQLGSCDSTAIDYENFKTYIRKCCLKPGPYILTCTNERKPYGWDKGYIKIQGHSYCNDFLSYRLMQRIIIKSMS